MAKQVMMIGNKPLVVKTISAPTASIMKYLDNLPNNKLITNTELAEALNYMNPDSLEVYSTMEVMLPYREIYQDGNRRYRVWGNKKAITRFRRLTGKIR